MNTVSLLLCVTVALFYSSSLVKGRANFFYKSADVNAATECPIARDCKAWRELGIHKSGIYPIKPDGGSAFQVYCDMDTDIGGWTVFLRRQDGSVEFNRNWVDYEKGFGNLNGEFWLGLSKIHRLTPDKMNTLRVDLGDFESNTAYAQYCEFEILDASTKYTIAVQNYHGTAGDAMNYHNGMKFSTKDADHDTHPVWQCARHHKGGWWFDQCYNSHLTGPYIPGGITNLWNGIIWKQWRGGTYSLKFSEAKVRRN